MNEIQFLVLLTLTAKVIQERKNKKMQTELETLIGSVKGRFFSITFEKKDGTIRTINGKDKYLRLLRGGENKVKDAGYVSAVNRNKEEWFCFKPNSVVRFKCGAIEKNLSV